VSIAPSFLKSAVKLWLIRLFSALGYDLFDRNLLTSYLKGDRIRARYSDSLLATGMEWSDNLPKQLRFYALYQMVEYAISKNPNADFAECGCWKGHSSHLIATLLNERDFSGQFHIFDSFEGGLSTLGIEDQNERKELTDEEIERQRKYFSSDIEEVQRNLSAFDFIRLYKGWIPDRFLEVEGRRFSFIHLDIDLYQPYWDSLCFFYERLEPGGVMCFDDYGFTQFPGAKKAVDQFFKEHPASFLFSIPTGGAFVIK